LPPAVQPHRGWGLFIFDFLYFPKIIKKNLKLFNLIFKRKKFETLKVIFRLIIIMEWLRFKLKTITVILLLTVASVYVSFSEIPDTMEAKFLKGAELFDKDLVLKIKINIPSESLKSLEKDARKYVPCELFEGGVSYTNVAIHLKGAAGSFRGISDKPAFTLSFNRFLPGQRFYGLRKIHLNNSVQDPSYISEKLCSELFIKAGVPTPRVNWALVELNEKKLGLYVLKEGFTKDFLSLYFNNTDGNLYDGGFLKDITDPLELDSGDDVKDRSDLKTLAEAALEKDLDKRWKRLNEVLDVERFISFMVIENMVWDWDGYVMNRNNYRVYHNLDDGKMVFFPHGMDQMFSVPDGAYHTPPNGIVARTLIQIPEAKILYRKRYIELLETVFVPYYITNRIAEMRSAIEPVLEKEDKNLLNNFQWGVKRVQELILKRIEFLNNLLIKPQSDKTQFNIAKVENWKEILHSGAKLYKDKIDGKDIFCIEANSECAAGFHYTMSLDQGVYTFEALVKTENVSSENDQYGATIRTSIGAKEQSSIINGTTDWKKVSCEFEVSSPGKEVDLICELKSKTGKAFFGSIQLIKVK